MNTDEIALRIAKNVFNTETHRAWSYEGGDEEIKEFAHALLAELSKDVEPSLYRWKTGHNFEYQFSEQRENAPECATKYFTHPAPVIASEQKPVAYLFEDGSAVIVANMVYVAEKSGQKVEPLFTSPPNTADIEQRTAEAIAHWIRCGDHHGVITSDDVLAGKWKEYL